MAVIDSLGFAVDTADLKKAQIELKRTGEVAGSAADNSERAMSKFGKAIGTTKSAIFSLKGAVGALGVSLAFREVIQANQAWTQQTNALKLVTSSSKELADVQNQLFDLAQRTRSGTEGTVDLYARLARSTKELNISQDRLIGVTETVNKAIAASGASAASADAALFQLGQGLAAGALRGEELNSVMEQTPRLAEAIATGLGVSTGELRKLGEQGELTAERVVAALESQASAIDSEFGKTNKTVSQALTQISNELEKTLGQIDDQGLIDALDSFRDTLSDPAIAQGLQTIASGLLSVAEGAIKSSAYMAGFVTDSDNIKYASNALAVVLATKLTPEIIKQSIKIKDLSKEYFDAQENTKLLKLQAIESAKAEVIRTEALVNEARAEAASAKAVNLRGAALTNINVRLKEATIENAIATQKLASAQANAAQKSKLLSSAGKGLLGLLGGWPGVIAGAATAITLWIAGSNNAEKSTKDWKSEIYELRGEMDKLEVRQITSKINETEEAINDLRETATSRVGVFEVLTGGGSERKQAQQDLITATKLLEELKAKRTELMTVGREKPGEKEATQAAPSIDLSGLVGGDKKQQKLKERLQERFETLRQSYLSETELALQAFNERTSLIEELEANKIGSEAERRQLSMESYAQYESELTEITLSEAEKRKEANRLEMESRFATTSQILNNLSSLMISKNRALFEAGKKAAIASAVIDTYKGAQGAFADTPGPVWVKAAAAGAATIAGLARVQAIQSQSFSGGGGVSNPGGGGGVTAGGGQPAEFTPPPGQQQSAAQQRKEVSVVVPTGLQSDNDMRNFIVRLNEVLGDMSSDTSITVAA